MRRKCDNSYHRLSADCLSQSSGLACIVSNTCAETSCRWHSRAGPRTASHTEPDHSTWVTRVSAGPVAVGTPDKHL